LFRYHIEIECRRVAIVIPARNEASTVGRVIAACSDLAASDPRFGPVVVVSDNSTDGTDDIARAAGAVVLRRTAASGSKAAAVQLGAQHVDTPHVLLVDADCVGLTAEHLRALCGSYLAGSGAMSVGVFDRAALALVVARFPMTTGQRILPRDVLLAACRGDGYGLETRINALVGGRGGVTTSWVLAGVGHVSKVVKRGRGPGLREWLGMYGQVARALATSEPAALGRFLLRVRVAGRAEGVRATRT
jgi:glycosyltransferase involved in cell wall biosynthesis